MDLRGLNDAQRAAVTARGGFHLVIAGAGTGKTRTLVHRVAWLIERGEDPGGIVLLTFTRRAAAEMLERASRLVGPSARRVRGGTFHAFASRSLRAHATKVGRSPDFTVMDRQDAEGLISLVRQDLGLGGKRRRFPNKATLYKLISRVANTGDSLADAVDLLAPRFVKDVDDIARVAKAYAERKQRGDLVDFDDLLVLLRRLLKQDAAARRDVAGRCRHVLVDEYQDTNRVQGHIAALLATHHGNLMVVGDEAQSIYGFRGATVENILEFPTVFKGAAQTVLDTNYRSTQPVLDLANAVLASARDGFDKRLHSPQPEGPRPRLVDVEDEAEEADFIVANVLALREQGVPLTDQAVLFRSGFHSAAVEGALIRANIPFTKFGGLRFAEAAHIKDVVALLRVVANVRDELAWDRVLQWLPNVGPKTSADIIRSIIDRDPPALDPSPWARRSFGPALADVADVVARARDVALPEQISIAVATVGASLEARYDDAWKRERDLEAIPLLARRHIDLDSFLADLALDPPDSAEAQPDTAEDEWLTLSTIHSAKGLEWTAVFFLQLADGRFPSGYALDDADAMEEERRLLYVALTRARRHLFLMQPRFVQTRGGWGGWGFGPGCSLLEQLEGLDRLVDPVTPSLPDPDADIDAAEGADDRLAEVLAWLDD